MVINSTLDVYLAGGLVLMQIEPDAHRHISVLEILAFHTQPSNGSSN